jgi:hypothetical protein
LMAARNADDLETITPNEAAFVASFEQSKATKAGAHDKANATVAGPLVPRR